MCVCACVCARVRAHGRVRVRAFVLRTRVVYVCYTQKLLPTTDPIQLQRQSMVAYHRRCRCRPHRAAASLSLHLQLCVHVSMCDYTCEVRTSILHHVENDAAPAAYSCVKPLSEVLRHSTAVNKL